MPDKPPPLDFRDMSQFCRWIADAKKTETRTRRARKMIQTLHDGRSIAEL